MSAMPGQPHRVEIESIHWPTVLPSIRLFETFKQAIHPAKLTLAFLLVLLLYLGGLGLDLIFGDQVFPREVATYVNDTPQRFARYLEIEVQTREQMIERGIELDEQFGIFESFLTAQRRAFGQLVASLATLNFGVTATVADHFGPGQNIHGGAIGALGLMVCTLPAWLIKTHPWFFGIYAVYAFALTALFGGAITRLQALQACRDLRQTPVAGLRFAAQRYLWLVLAPLIPLLMAGVVALLLAVAGSVLFNVPVLEIVGGVLYGPALVLGLIIALVLIGLALAVHVLYPAIATENADAFDAISRAYNYVIGRPVRFLVYGLVSLVYFALAYLLVSLVLAATIWATNAALGAWTFTEAAEGVTRFDALVALAQDQTVPDDVSATVGVAGWIAKLWTTLLLMLLPAFAVSFYFCASTWIYLLLRRSADGVEFDDVYLPADPEEPTAPTEPTEPTETPEPSAAPHDQDSAPNPGRA